MRAKLINESISDVLTPKSEKEIKETKEKIFFEKQGITIEQANAIVDELKKYGIDIRLRISNDAVLESPFSLQPYKVLDGNRVIVETATKEGAEEIIKTLLDNSLRPNQLTVDKSDSFGNYLNAKDAKILLNKLRYKIKTHSYTDKIVNLDRKYEDDNYWQWDEGRRQRAAMKKANESYKDILKPKSNKEIEQALKKITRKFFTVGNLKKYLNTISDDLPIGTSGHFGEFNPMNKSDFWVTTSHPVPSNRSWRYALDVDMPILNIISPDIGPDPD